MKTTFSLLWMR